MNTGVPPAGSGHSAEPGPISVVPAETASVPNATAAYLDSAIESFDRDPPDTDFQRGYLEALKAVRAEATL